MIRHWIFTHLAKELLLACVAAILYEALHEGVLMLLDMTAA